MVDRFEEYTELTLNILKEIDKISNKYNLSAEEKFAATLNFQSSIYFLGYLIHSCPKSELNSNLNEQINEENQDITKQEVRKV